jgi:arylsulfatase A-like enzyme
MESKFSTKRHNILLIHSDQHRYDCVGVNGHTLVRTPNMDRLAAEGTNFNHAFCPMPMCVPERNSLLTGTWPLVNGCIFNYDAEVFHPVRKDLPTFSSLLNQAGYYLGYVGKWHVHPRLGPLDFHFHDYIAEGEYFPWRKEQNLPDQPRDNRWFGQTDPHIKPEQSCLAWEADTVISLLEKQAATDQPFFIRWDPVEPHLPNRVPEPYASMYPPENISPWPGFDEEFTNKPYIQRQQLRTWKIDNWTWEDWAPVVGRYLGEISLLDAQLGRVLDALERLGAANDTLVIYTSDHGDMCGSHRMIDKHFIMYDDVVRVPLIMRWPGKLPVGTTCDDFVCHAIDMARTFCEAAGVETPETFAGQSLSALACGKAKSTRQDIFATYHGNQFGLYSQRMVRDRRWKYIWNATAEDELYDLENDPGELHNLAQNSECAGQLRRLRLRLVEWMEDTGDTLLNTWTKPQIEEGRKV